MNKKIFLHAVLFCLIVFSVTQLWSQEKKLFPVYLELSIPVLLNEDGFFDSYTTNTTYLNKGTSLGNTEANLMSFETYSIGWKFPREKGKIVIAYSNYQEESSDTLINHHIWDDGKASMVVDDYYDPNLDLSFFDGPSNYLIKGLDINLETETTIYDAAFWKNFGKGKRLSGTWNAGFRFAKHNQNIPIGYFSLFSNPLSVPDIGDKYASDFFTIHGESKSYGPKGGGIINLYLFNKRLILSAGADVSLTFGTTEIPKQVFPIAVSWAFDAEMNIDLIFPEELGIEPYTIAQKEDKSYWFTTIDFNAKIKIFKELYLFIGYRAADFRNIALSPSVVNAPTDKDDPPSGLFVSYTFEDIAYRTPYFGISIQF